MECIGDMHTRHPSDNIRPKKDDVIIVIIIRISVLRIVILANGLLGYKLPI